MPKLLHEALVELVRDAPAMVLRLLWPESRELAARVHVAAGEFVDLNLAEYHADAVLVVDDPTRPSRVLIVEVQTAIDPRKRRSWPVYVAGLHVRHGCPVDLVVVALDREVARWAAMPIVIGERCCVVSPRVIGPDMVPAITDAGSARQAPELAVLSVAAHGDEAGAEHIALAALAAAHDLDRDREYKYRDFIKAFLGRAARAALEQLMATSRGKNPYFSEEFREFYARGEAKMLLKLVALKGFTPTDAERERILGCIDSDVLEEWADRLLVARTLAEMFDGPPGSDGP
jgi:hypothetical protein